MIAAVLDSSGYKVGLVTSPHLHSLTERIRIGSEPISKNDFTNLVKQIWPLVLETGQNSQYGEVTWFEFMVSAAFHFFVNPMSISKLLKLDWAGGWMRQTYYYLSFQ